jgi:hypothetical protein
MGAAFQRCGLALLLVGCGSGNHAANGAADAASASGGGDATASSGSGSGGSGSSGSSSDGSGSGGSGSGGSGSSGSGSSESGSPPSEGGSCVYPDDGGAPSGSADGGCPGSTKYLQTCFANLAVQPGAKLDPSENDMVAGDAAIAAPPGWNFYGKDGALCRDGSPAGFYVHFASTDKLFIYLEGGGACDSVSFCQHNPANLTTVFSGGAASQGQTILGSLTTTTALQAPYVPTGGDGGTAYSPGIFDFTNPANPFKDWSGVYVPYCTGDVHFGTRDNVTIPTDGVSPALPNQHFVGHLNLEKFIARIVPTFPSVSQVVLAGASAGAFGAGLNYGMVQDSFGANVPVVVLDDSGPPFSAQYLAPCVQKNWRAIWGFDGALPPDCAECFQPDGSGLTNIFYYWLQKYQKASFGMVSTSQDEVMRLFFAQGNNNCASDNATWDGLVQILGSGYSGMMYTQGLNDLLTAFQCSGRIAGYLIGGQNPNYPNPTYHQHIFRSEFYQAITNDGGITMAEWTSDLIGGNLQIVGP